MCEGFKRLKLLGASADARTPEGGLSGRGQDAPARNRFKGIQEILKRAKGEIEIPPPS